MSTTTHATCDDCHRVMNPGVGCTLTHVSLGEDAQPVKRIFCGEGDDWGADCVGGVCHDCNAGPGQPHHAGCDIERCPKCGGQMLGCLGPPDEEFGGCGWLYLMTRA
ncbi:MAG TPA: hypothetical protein VLA89_02870 [Gemmatimonadales bacterium]|nr:hypothetical protein [Gemmatimonadales bacterium]